MIEKLDVVYEMVDSSQLFSRGGLAVVLFVDSSSA